MSKLSFKNFNRNVLSFSVKICVKVYIYHSCLIAYCFPDQDQKKRKENLIFF